MTFCTTRINMRVGGKTAENSQLRTAKNSKKAGGDIKGESVSSACVCESVRLSEERGQDSLMAVLSLLCECYPPEAGG